MILVWSEWDCLDDESLLEICTLTWEDFVGPWMERHRTDLLQRLDHVPGQLGMGPEHLRQQDPGINEVNIQQRDRELKEVLLEVEESGL